MSTERKFGIGQKVTFKSSAKDNPWDGQTATVRQLSAVDGGEKDYFVRFENDDKDTLWVQEEQLTAQ